MLLASWRRWRDPKKEKPARTFDKVLSLPKPASVFVEGEYGGTVCRCWYDHGNAQWHIVDFHGDGFIMFEAPNRWRYLERRDAKAG